MSFHGSGSRHPKDLLREAGDRATKYLSPYVLTKHHAPEGTTINERGRRGDLLIARGRSESAPTRRFHSNTTGICGGSMNIHFIQHDSWVLPGEYLAWAKRHEFGISITKCWQYDPIPEKADADMLVILGGCQCPATTKEECDYFDAMVEDYPRCKKTEQGLSE